MRSYRFLFIIVIIFTFLFFFLRYLLNYDLAKTAKIEDFYGSWTGKLEGQSPKTTLRIDGTGANFENFPVVSSSSGEVFFYSGFASIEFQSTFSIEAPCVLINCTNHGGYIFPIYITENKNQLFYPVSPGRALNMGFKKTMISK